MSTTVHPSLIAERLTTAGAHRVVTPDQPDYRAELAAFNLTVQHRPAAVVAASRDSDVVAAVRVADELDLPVTVIGFGHGVLDPADGGIAVTTRGLAGVEIDAHARCLSPRTSARCPSSSSSTATATSTTPASTS